MKDFTDFPDIFDAGEKSEKAFIHKYLKADKTLAKEAK
jgi:hypothetical protein